MERRSLLEEAPEPFFGIFEIVWIPCGTVRSHQHLGNSLSVERQRIGGERRYPVFSVFHPAERLKDDTVFRSSLFSQIPGHRLRHELSRHGSHPKSSESF